MIPALTTEQMAEVDRLMIEEYGILLIQMMENAGRSLAIQASRMLGGSPAGSRLVVLCGGGNNGGGGMVAARHLHNWGGEVSVKLTTEAERLKEIPAHQWELLKRMGVPGAAEEAELPDDPALILDAVIGYGLRGDPRGAAARWIRWANQRRSPVLALDTPSGLDATSGTPGDPCIRAAATLTLALPKVGLMQPQAGPFVGDLLLADISVPPGLYRRLGIEVGPIFAEDTIISVR